jgi:hypothetical protein
MGEFTGRIREPLQTIKENMDDAPFYRQPEYSDCPGGNECRCVRFECGLPSPWKALPSRVRDLLRPNHLLQFDRQVQRHDPASSGAERRSSAAGTGSRREINLGCG